MKKYTISHADDDLDDLSFLDWEEDFDLDHQEEQHRKRKVQARKKREIKRRLDNHLEAKNLRRTLSYNDSWS